MLKYGELITEKFFLIHAAASKVICFLVPQHVMHTQYLHSEEISWEVC